MSTGKLNAGGNRAVGQHFIQGGVERLLVASYRDKLWPDGLLGSYADSTYLKGTTWVQMGIHWCMGEVSAVITYANDINKV